MSMIDAKRTAQKIDMVFARTCDGLTRELAVANDVREALQSWFSILNDIENESDPRVKQRLIEELRARASRGLFQLFVDAGSDNHLTPFVKRIVRSQTIVDLMEELVEALSGQGEEDRYDRSL